MKGLEKLPFKIGMNCEHWEFDLKVEELSNYYELYRYIKGNITTLNILRLQIFSCISN
tara:strand:+ start:320 stop:493 length:174 start_codon:yes stop_codon:yes gene_type:complete